MKGDITRFDLCIAQDQIDQLHCKLETTRWPDSQTVMDWSQGVPIGELRRLAHHWRDKYDWRRCESMLNDLGQFKSEIDGLEIHFLHVRSPHCDALPLIMTHGWPGSVIEFTKVIGPLTNPAAFGGSATDAFHLVLPSLPGYGFSARPTATGWNVERIARAWIGLMKRLGYARWGAQGGDWGSAVTSYIGQLSPAALCGIHLNVPFVALPSDLADATEEEHAILADRSRYNQWLSGYALQQATRPQTLGYGLVDSPIGLAAWIYERFYEWSDHGGNFASLFTLDELIDNIMLYWLPATGASAGRLYWESLMKLPYGKVNVPTGVSIFPREMHRASRRWVERDYPNLVHFGTPKKGGHFAAFEQPGLFVDEVRKTFAPLRGAI